MVTLLNLETFHKMMPLSGQQSPFGPTEWALAMIVNVAFALNIIAMKVVVGATAPLLSVALRMVMVLLLCLPWFRLVPGRNLALAAYGVLNGGLFLLVLNDRPADAGRFIGGG